MQGVAPLEYLFDEIPAVLVEDTPMDGNGVAPVQGLHTQSHVARVSDVHGAPGAMHLHADLLAIALLDGGGG